MPVANQNAVVRRRLLHHHYQRVTQIYGLADSTIGRMLIRSDTEDEQQRLTKLVNSPVPPGPAIVVPHFDQHGTRLDHHVLRHDYPSLYRKYCGTAPRKYHGRLGEIRLPYFVPLLKAIEDYNAPDAMVAITEGMFKAAKCSQAGIATIGLLGVNAWSASDKSEDHDDKRKKKHRRLIPELEAVACPGKLMPIIFDFDPRRNPIINYEAALLACALEALGAIAPIIRLPPGPRDQLGKFTKNGLDDFIVRIGEAAFRVWLNAQLAGPLIRDLDGYRREVAANLRNAVTQPGKTFLMAAQMGTGKTHGIIGAAEELNGQGVLVTEKTHLNCEEVKDKLESHGVSAGTNLKHCEQTCKLFKAAVDLNRQGFSHRQILCPNRCPHRDGCPYYERVKSNDEVQVAIHTHALAGFKMDTLAEDKVALFIDESPRGSAVRDYKVVGGEGGMELLKISMIADRAAESAKHPLDQDFYERMGAIARDFDGWLKRAEERTCIELTPAYSYHVPFDLMNDIYEAKEQLNLRTDADALHLVIEAAKGELQDVIVQVDVTGRERTDNGVKVNTQRTLVGYGKMELPVHTANIISSADMDVAEVQELLGVQGVEDITPEGTLATIHPIVQIPAEITQKTSAADFTTILTNVLKRIPNQYQRIGVITQMAHVKTVEELAATEQRIVKVSYYGKGDTAGSNEWIEHCDCLIVAGTYRPPASALRTTLGRHGRKHAVTLTEAEYGFGNDYWHGVTQSGKGVLVRCLAYRDHDWYWAQCVMSKREIRQAVGRGRGNLPEGKPVFVVTTENLCPDNQLDGKLGYPLIDNWPPNRTGPMTDAEAGVFDFIQKTYSENVTPVATSMIVKHFGYKSRNAANKHLRALEEVGMIRRKSEKSGWEPA